MSTWIESIFSSEAGGDDLVKSGALNITKITALLVPIGTGIIALLTRW